MMVKQAGLTLVKWAGLTTVDAGQMGRQVRVGGVGRLRGGPAGALGPGRSRVRGPLFFLTDWSKFDWSNIIGQITPL
jgi:hypothetical protein